MNNTAKFLLESTIISSTMIATRDVISQNAYIYNRHSALSRTACNISGASLGYFIGRKVSSFCVKAIDDFITAYRAEA